MSSGKKPSPRLLVDCAASFVAIGMCRRRRPKKPQIFSRGLVRQTVAQEVAAANKPPAKHMFSSRKQTPKGSQTRLYIETKDAMAGMLMAINDQPLRAAATAEKDHSTWLSNNPDQLRKKQRAKKKIPIARCAS